MDFKTSNVKDMVLSDFEHQLETTNFDDENDMDNSYQYMVSQLDIHYRDKNVDDESLTLYDIMNIMNILGDIEKYTLKEAYETIISYLEELEEE